MRPVIRELLILLASVAGFSAAVAAYLAAFHGEVSLKEVLSTAFAAVIGLYVGRALERRLAHG